MTRFRTFSVISFLVAISFASLQEVKAGALKDFCQGNPCSTRQQEISNEFLAAGPLRTQSFPALFSGECFHLGGGYRPTDTHHAAIAIDTYGEGYVMGGSFGFFHDENPFASMTFEQARASGFIKYRDTHLLQLFPSHAELQFDALPDDVIRYWLRQNESGDRLTLVMQWSYGHIGFCRLNRHP